MEGKTFGKIIIVLIWCITIPVTIIIGILLLIEVDTTILPQTKHDDVAYIIRQSANIKEMGKNGVTESCSYIVKLSSGKEEEINFKICEDFREGKKLKISYLKSKITKHINLLNYEKLNDDFDKTVKNHKEKRDGAN